MHSNPRNSDLACKIAKKVNKLREGKKYKDEEAAVAKWGKANKVPLKQNLIFKFEYGVAGVEYWQYQHMVLQLEDCVDMLKVMYPQYNFLFLFDHSCGHDRQRDDGLNIENMPKKYGGQQAVLCSITVKQEQEYLPYHQILKPGDEQSMVLSKGIWGLSGCQSKNERRN